MQERITLMGRVAADPQRIATKESGSLGPVTFRFATNDSRWDDASRSWVDGGTNWYTVKAWRTLGDNVLTSIAKGQPLIVHGRLELTAWTDQAGRERVTPTIHADALGHDLRRGVTTFAARSSEQGRGADATAGAAAVAEPVAADPVAAVEERWADPADLVDLPF